jgi:inhibitor of the pro-sigma K processing machinery
MRYILRGKKCYGSYLLACCIRCSRKLNGGIYHDTSFFGLVYYFNGLGCLFIFTKFIKFTIHVLGGVVGLWLVNLLLSVFAVEIPINIFTVCLVAILGFPGVLVLTVLQLLGV